MTSITSPYADANRAVVSAQEAAFRQAFRSLTTAVYEGDMVRAKSAYDVLGRSQGAEAPVDAPFTRFLAMLGPALSNGNSKAARDAFMHLRQPRQPSSAGTPEMQPAGLRQAPAPGTGNIVDLEV